MHFFKGFVFPWKIPVKGDQDTADLGPNTDANRTCIKFFGQVSGRYCLLMLMKEYNFVSY